MSETSRVAQFKTDVEDLRLKTSNSPREGLYITVGVVLMIVGILLGVGGWMSSTNQNDPRDQTDLVTLAIAGVSITIFGAALFLRYSVGRFLRFWMLRLLYEAQDD